MTLKAPPSARKRMRIHNVKQTKRSIVQCTELSEEAAKYLLQWEPKMIGTDSLAIDDLKNDFRAHKAILRADVPIIEGLVNLDKLIGKTFDVMAFPLKIDGLEASPARVLARLC